MNIYQKLLEIQREIQGLGPDGNGFGYKYVTNSKVVHYIKPLMNKYGLLLKQEVTNVENQRIDYLNKKGEQKSEIFTTTYLLFTWIDAETGEKDENHFVANGMNDWEKGLGSALTYGERYFFLKYFHIATDEDDIDNPERKAEEQKIADAEAQKVVKQQEFTTTCQNAEIALKKCANLNELADTFGKLTPAVKKVVLKIKDDQKVILSKTNTPAS